jgi:hypothetical protein
MHQFALALRIVTVRHEWNLETILDFTSSEVVLIYIPSCQHRIYGGKGVPIVISSVGLWGEEAQRGKNCQLACAPRNT